MKIKGMSEEEAAIKVDKCLAQIKKEPVLELMYLHDMLGLNLRVDDEYVET